MSVRVSMATKGCPKIGPPENAQVLSLLHRTLALKI